MKIAAELVFVFAAWALSAAYPRNSTEPFSNVPVEQRQQLTARVGVYVKAYRGRKWNQLYDYVSDTGKGGVDRRAFIAAMKSEHGSDFAQMPDLQEFKPGRAEKNGSGFDIYGCGTAQREGMMFNGIAVMHALFEHGNWFFTGWRFTEFPNEPCEQLAHPNWQPDNHVKWDRPMEEVAHFKSKGTSFHIDSPH
jgi:hypothetical protein